MLLRLEAVTQGFGLNISVPKTKIIPIHRHKSPEPVEVEIRGETVEVVNQEKYLGSILSSDGKMDKEIAKRISVATYKFKLYDFIWRDKYIGLKTKTILFKVIVLPAFLYSCETWDLIEREYSRIGVVYMRFLRRLLGVKLSDRLSNEEILSKCEMAPVRNIILHRRFCWLGHIGRLSDDRLVKKITFANLKGKMPAGKPPSCWCESTHKILNDRSKKDSPGYILHGLKNTERWYNKCQDRTGWFALLSDAIPIV
jgi:hypothetical protein